MISRYSFSTFLLLSLLLIESGALAQDDSSAKPGEQVETKSTVKVGETESEIRYLLYLPKNYESAKSVPLVIFLHGSGERGDDLQQVAKWGPPQMIAQGKSFDAIMVSPQCDSGKRWNPDEIAALADSLAEKYKVDRTRMYLTGLSMGGYGTWATLAKFPKLFAAGIPICGGGDPGQAEILKSIPIWAFHGDKDDAVPVEKTKEMIEAINKVGGKAKMTIYEGVGHQSWSQTYDNPEVFQWLFEQVRQN